MAFPAHDTSLCQSAVLRSDHYRACLVCVACGRESGPYVRPQQTRVCVAKVSVVVVVGREAVALRLMDRILNVNREAQVVRLLCLRATAVPLSHNSAPSQPLLRHFLLA